MDDWQEQDEVLEGCYQNLESEGKGEAKGKAEQTC